MLFRNDPISVRWSERMCLVRDTSICHACVWVFSLYFINVVIQFGFLSGRIAFKFRQQQQKIYDRIYFDFSFRLWILISKSTSQFKWATVIISHWQTSQIHAIAQKCGGRGQMKFRERKKEIQTISWTICN